MFAIPSLQEFYSETLKSNGFTPKEDDLAKVAAANGIDIETAKLANSIFEQFQLDGVPFNSPKEMLESAMKMAGAYLELQKEQTDKATKLAADLHRVALHAVEGFLSNNRIELDANEGVKIAGLQAGSFQELTQREAELRQIETKLASLKFVGEIKIANIYNSLGTAAPQTPENLNVDALYASMGEGYGADPAHLKAFVAGTVPEANRAQYHHALAQAAQQGHGKGGFMDLHNHVMQTGPAGAAGAGAGAAAAAAKPGLMSRPGVLLGAGALGLGALALMQKRRREREAGANRANAIANVAGLPAA